MNSRLMPKIIVRLPPDVKKWLADEADRNGSSQNSEILRSLRERMERTHQGAR